MKEDKRNGRPGFTLVEILISTILLGSLMGFLFHFFSGSSKKALQGICRNETVLEAQRILKQIRGDLKLFAHYENPQKLNANTFEASSFFLAEANREYEFSKFPFHEEISKSLSRKEMNSLDAIVVELEKVRYSLEDQPNSPLKKLVRQEGTSGNSRVLSERVAFFDISMHQEIPTSKNGSDYFLYFSLTIQLYDGFQEAESLAELKFQSLKETREMFATKGKRFIIADFFDIVYPEEWNRFIQHFPENEWPSFKILKANEGL